MLKLFDFVCQKCDHAFEALAETNERPACPTCGGKTDRRLGCARPFETIKATSMTSKTYKAGWAHKRNEPGTKIQVSVPKNI